MVKLAFTAKYQNDEYCLEIYFDKAKFNIFLVSTKYSKISPFIQFLFIRDLQQTFFFVTTIQVLHSLPLQGINFQTLSEEFRFP